MYKLKIKLFTTNRKDKKSRSSWLLVFLFLWRPTSIPDDVKAKHVTKWQPPDVQGEGGGGSVWGTAPFLPTTGSSSRWYAQSTMVAFLASPPGSSPLLINNIFYRSVLLCFANCNWWLFLPSFYLKNLCILLFTAFWLFENEFLS